MTSEQNRENLRQAALDFSQSITPLSGEIGRLRLLETSANTAHLLICSELQSLSQLVPLTAKRQQQAELATTQAATLSGSIALFYGESPVGPFLEDWLTTGGHACFLSKHH